MNPGMLSIFDDSALQTCRGISRRELLRVGGLGLGGLTLASLLNDRAAASRRPKWVRDKSVVLLFLQGGPPQIEMFDPKPDAPANIRSCTGDIETKTAGVRFGATFPELAKRMDRFSIVRSFASGDGGHNQLPVLTGNSPLKGTMGAHYARLAGANHPSTAMPTNAVVLPEAIQPDLKLGNPTGPFSYKYIQKNYVTGGNLGSAYNALLLDGGGTLTQNLKLALPRKRFDDRRALLQKLNSVQRSLDRAGSAGDVEAYRRQAYDVLIKGIADAFDLSKEDKQTIAKYDTSHMFRMRDWHKGGRNYAGLRNQSRITNLLGKQMLLARRLCEAGCGFVTVVDGCWDFHGDGNNPPTPIGMPLLGPQADHAIAAFLDDVEARGLSDKILLLVTGEMGRSPKKNNKNGGTGHWGRLTPLLVAGGGLKMGRIIGKTDRQGGEATTTQYLPQNLLATVMQTLFDPAEARLDSSLPADLARIITAGEPIRELI